MDGIRAGARKRISKTGQEGQILLMYMIFLLPMTFMVFSVYNIGMLTTEKMKVQNAADNAAYSAAVWEARYMNLSAYVNRTMIANYDALATLDALWSFADATEGFMFFASFVTQFIPYIGPEISEALRAIHDVVNPINDALARAVGSNAQGENFGFGQYVEKYNKVLSLSQEGLYMLTQLGRQKVIKSIAWGVNRDIQYDNFAEILNALSLDSRRKWHATDGDDGTASGDDGLRLSTERSLNEFAVGGSIRDGLQNILPVPTSISLFICDFGLTQLGPGGFDGPRFDRVNGGAESCPDPQGRDCKEKIAQKERIYEHDSFGVTIDLCVTDIDIAHHSDDQYNKVILLHITDYEHTGSNYEESHYNNFGDNGISCSPVALGGNIPNLNLGNGSDAMQDCQDKRQTNQACDAQRAQIQSQNQGKPPEQQQALPDCFVDENTVLNGTPTACDDVKDGVKDAIKDFKDQLNTALGTPCGTMYNFSDDEHLDQVKVGTYVEDKDVADGQRLEGPTVFVYFRKKLAFLPLIQGLALTTPNDVEAYSFGKVYYKQRPGNPNKEKESLFNPFWEARLEKPRPFGTNSLLH